MTTDTPAPAVRPHTGGHMDARATLSSLIHDALRSQEYYDLSGPWGDGPDEPAHPLNDLEAALSEALAEVRSLRVHAHEWDDDSRCVVCGADGLA